MLPDQTTTLNESWLCFINSRENIRNADTNNFLIFISYSSFKVRFISQCNLHLKSRTRAVKLQKKKYWNSRKSNFAASRIYILFFFCRTKFNLKSAFICFSTKWTNTMHISQLFPLFSSRKLIFMNDMELIFFPRMSQHFKRFKTLLSMFFLTGTLDINLNIKWN